MKTAPNIVQRPKPAPETGAPGSVRIPPPPRNVPWYVTAALVFMNRLTQAGWLFLGVGLMIVWQVAPTADLSIPVFWGGVDVCQGRIISVGPTSYSENHSVVYKLAYEYTDSAGTKHTDVSYSSSLDAKPGAACSVEIAKRNPSLARIQGATRRPFGLAMLFVLVFPMFGLAAVIASARSGLRTARVLRNGQVTYVSNDFADEEADDESAEDTDDEPNTNDEAEDDPSETDEPEPAGWFVIEDPKTPSVVIDLDPLPLNMRISDEGRVEMERGRAQQLPLWFLLPLLVIVVNAWYFYCAFLK